MKTLFDWLLSAVVAFLAMLVLFGWLGAFCGCDFSDLEQTHDSTAVAHCSYVASHPYWDQDLYYRCLHGYAQPAGDAGADTGENFQ